MDDVSPVSMAGGATQGGSAVSPTGVVCPRCGEGAAVELEKADPGANTCYRCRPCGHIFSPRR